MAGATRRLLGVAKRYDDENNLFTQPLDRRARWQVSHFLYDHVLLKQFNQYREIIMKHRLLIIASYVLVSAITMFGADMVSAKDCNGVSFPDQSLVAGSALTLNGLGLRQATMLKVNVYVAALYVAKVSADANTILGANTPKEIILHFVRDVDAGELQKAWEEGFVSNAGEQMSTLKERIEKLKGWMADMKSGQQLTFTHKPGAGIEVNVNGTVKGTIDGDDFAKAFFSIWLGAHPPNEDLKAGLLGGSCG
jgi:hypothetical protein